MEFALICGIFCDFSVQTAVVWLRVLLQTHASQLMAIGTTELFTRFGPLLGIIEHRANSLHSLSK